MQNYYEFFVQIQSQLKDILIIPHFSQNKLILVDVISSNKIGQIQINGNCSILCVDGNKSDSFDNELIGQKIFEFFSQPIPVKCSILDQPLSVIDQGANYSQNHQGPISEIQPTLQRKTYSTIPERYQLPPQPNFLSPLSLQTKLSQVSQNTSQMNVSQGSGQGTFPPTRKQKVTKDKKMSMSKVKQVNDTELKTSTTKRHKEKVSNVDPSPPSHRIDNSNQLPVDDKCRWSPIKPESKKTSPQKIEHKEKKDQKEKRDAKEQTEGSKFKVLKKR
ncbi:hypothetical protein EDI_325800 [Entamoeba dispar SAW760]|uniref:Uncharacterized protein n=1 Tax=Entamoeba dispar (strain ATCC PRA-260 / SAW760) TaxID=370354 RepID=B0E7Q7_ENTDS|nr:uncharacterized protein EDI_325800 [Entamoeba dispar SAW760]EDR29438.1 hypothetical protein EDI_325800 [Entamoeba dispar SAW760]|eukprot:EDR29438.1 hypothetical protein EDI_325800 [Entamoeba dispar SAW760]